MPSPQRNNARFAFNLLALAVAMLLLAFASVPLYRLFCQATGFGGTPHEGAAIHSKPLERTITVSFNADVSPGLKWEFRPGERSHVVHVGEQAMTWFIAKNLTRKPITGRATYNVLPFKAGAYFVKVQCFCFKEQTLAPGQEVRMPVSFYIDPSVMGDPDMENVKTITLSYSFFKVDK